MTSVLLSCFVLAMAATESPLALSDQFHRGVNHAHVHRAERGYGSDVSAQELAALRDLGVNWVALTPFGYQQKADDPTLAGFDPATNRFTPRDHTLRDSGLVAETKAAHALGMKVALKPHIWSNDFGHGAEWHGSIRQKSDDEHASWWQAYRAVILHYAEIASEAGIDLYVVGTELVQMTTTRHSGEWRQLIADVRKRYDGPLTYAAHWDGEFQAIAFWKDLEYVGINAYFPLETESNADVEMLISAWQAHRKKIEQVQAPINKPVLFLEAGYRPVTDTHRRPWETRGGELDPQAQALAYEALFRAFAGAEWWSGLYLWKSFTDPQRGAKRADGTSFAFRFRPAEQVVARWYTAATQP